MTMRRRAAVRRRRRSEVCGVFVVNVMMLYFANTTVDWLDT